MTVLYILLAIVVLLFMILIHEFGHYVIGRLLNFKITEFSIGFGKALFSRINKRGEKISLRIFPLGGYCAFAGEEETNVDNKEAFTNQKPWKRILVFFAGVTFNFASAILFSLILLCTVGCDIPKVDNLNFDATKITRYVSHQTSTFDMDNTFKPGDVIISLDGKKIDIAYGVNYSYALNNMTIHLKEIKIEQGDEFDEEAAFLEYNPTFTATVKRGNHYVEVVSGFQQIKIQKSDGSGYTYAYKYCINASAYVHSFVEAVERAVPFTFGFAWIVLKSLWLLITFQLPIKEFGGTVTAITTIASVAKSNISNLLVYLPFIAANLAVINILPIPALDGSHVVFTTIEAIRKKPIKREIENLIHTIGLVVLFGAAILIDILHFVL